MADRIITVTNPSVVTNDTLIGYNNYTDQPSADTPLGEMMTPTEATNGHTVALSEGSVHQVTTKPVGTTNGEFSAVVSNAVTVDLSVLFFDGFTGTTIDTAKWNDNQTSDVVITQNDELICTPAGSSDSDSYISYLSGASSFIVPAATYVLFDLRTALQGSSSENYNWFVGISKFDTNVFTDCMGLTNSGTAGNVTNIYYKTGQTVVTNTQPVDLSTTKKMMMAFNETHMLLWVLDGTWTQLGIQKSIVGVVGESWYPVIFTSDKSGVTTPIYIDNFEVTDVDPT